MSGELLAVVGPNGAGKSTLLRVLAGEMTPATGEVHLLGRPVEGASPLELARVRAVLPQQTVIRFAFRCLDVVVMGRYAIAEDAAPEEAARAAMTSTDTAVFEERSFPTLSGGEQDRVSLARVLAQETPILFLDEPTGGLDLRHEELVMSTLRGLAEQGACVVVVLHDLNVAARWAQRVAMMSHGTIAAMGATAEVLTAEMIEGVYGQAVDIVTHPHSGAPVILPR